MHILYINDELSTADGSNYHANGILRNLKHILGKDNVRSFPQAVDGSQMHTNHTNLNLQKKHKNIMQLIRIFRKTILSYTRSRRLCHELEQSGWIPTHILARTIMFDTTALMVARHFNAKLICEVNTPMYYEHCIMNHLPFQKVVEHWEKKLLIHSDSIYVVSNVCRDMLCEHYGVEPSRFIVVPNGYMKNLYPLQDSNREEIRCQIRSRENLSDKFVVTFIGSLKPWHGIGLLCQVAQLLASDSRIHFLVAGDGSERGQVEAYCSTHNNMTYKGKLPLSEMSEYLTASDLGIMPYAKMNNFYFSPLKMFDMIGAGLPFIGTDQGQIHDICAELLNENFLIQDCNPVAVSQQIIKLVESPSIHEQMKEKVCTVQQSMTWENRTSALLDRIVSPF